MKLLFLFVAIGILACNSHSTSKTAVSEKTPTGPAIPDFDVAIKFINDYASYCAAESPKRDDEKWIENDSLLSASFKSRYKTLLDSARKKDPELGLGSDPIFDAQDFPEKGFSIVKADTASGYITVNGNDWKDFELVLKMTQENNKWLVDGAGVINVPPEKRAKRE